MQERCQQHQLHKKNYIVKPDGPGRQRQYSGTGRRGCANKIFAFLPCPMHDSPRTVRRAVADTVGLCISCSSSWYWMLTSHITSPLSVRLRLFMMVSVARMVPPPSSEVELMACLELTVLPLLWAMGIRLWYHCLTGLGESVASQVKETVLSATRDIVMSVGSRTVSLVQLRRGRDEWEWRHGIHWANTCVMQRIQWSRKVWLGYYRLRDRLSTCIANSVAQCRSTCRFIFAHYSAWLLQSLVSYSPKQTCGAAQHLPHHVLIHTVALCL